MDQDRERQATAEVAKDKSEEEEDEEFDHTGGESLLSLVQPEMITLSKHWQAALKDHALLSLPPGRSDDHCKG